MVSHRIAIMTTENNKQNDLKLPYALNSNDELVSINSIKEHGLACNCRCPKCKEPLEARIGTGKRVPYFAHSKHTNCHGAMMTILHRHSIEIIEKNKAVMVPQYHNTPTCLLQFVEVEVEKREDRKDMQPDIVGITSDGKRWAIEIKNTHEVDLIKKQKIFETGIYCLEIDVRKQSVETLEEFLLNTILDRCWIDPDNEDPSSKPRSVEITIEPQETSRYLENIYCKDISVPEYIYKERKQIIHKNEGCRLKIPINCLTISDCISFFRSQDICYYKGRRHIICAKEFSSICEQIIIVHRDSTGFSHHYLSCIFLDTDGYYRDETLTCGYDNYPLLIDAIKEDWKEKEKILKENQDLPFPKRNKSNLPF